MQKNKITVGSFWINDFRKGSNDDPLQYADDMAQGFGKAFKEGGHQWKINHGSLKASPISWLSFPAKSGSTFDDEEAHAGADTVNFIYIVSHGGITFRETNPDKENIFIYRLAFGIPTADAPEEAFKARDVEGAFPRFIWLNRHSKLGNKNLKWLIVDGCNSMQLPGFEKHLGMNLDVNPSKLWSKVFHGLNMIFGFHNDSTDGWWVSDRGEEFGSRAADGDALGNAWTDECYSYWTRETPVAMACGATEKEAKERLARDTIDRPQPQVQRSRAKWFSYEWRSR